jgi:tetratricopeptide (TPR) repeat protein
MKKFLLSIILGMVICGNLSVYANEIEEDYLDIAANYCVVGDYQSAMVYLDKILEMNPSNTKVIDLKKGLAHVIAKDKKTFVTSVNPYIKQAHEYKRVGDDKKELEALIEGTQSNNAYLAYYYLGNYHRDNNDYLKALDSYNAALSVKPDFAQAYLASALTLFDVKRYNSVINPIDKYLTFNPNDDLAYAVKSRVEFEQGMLEESKKDNAKAIALNNCPEYQFDRAKILYKSGNYQVAKDIFTELLPDIQTSKTYEYMGLCDLALKDYMSALMNIDKALILSDDDEYLQNKYNEIKKILESNNNE